MFKKYHLKSYNFRLVLLVIIAAIYGTVVINSANSDYTQKQIFGLIISICVLICVSFLDYSWVLKFFWLWYVVDIVLLIMVKIAGASSHGAKRWVNIAGIQFQPSELSKLILIIVTVKILVMFKDKVNSLQCLGTLAVVLGIPLILTASQPDLSTTALTFLILFVIIFCAGLSYKIIGIAILITVPILVGGLFYISDPNNELFFLESYQRKRIMDFVNKDSEDSADGAYQQEKAIIAIGSGELQGKGLGNDDPTSLKNANFIAEAQTDFIFAIIGEELGFIGCCSAIVILALIVFECIIVAIRAKELGARLLCLGVAIYIGFQAFINIGVVTRILPNTGVPLPFFSYGLTSLVTLFIALGLVLNVSLQRRVLRDDEIFAKDFKG